MANEFRLVDQSVKTKQAKSHPCIRLAVGKSGEITTSDGTIAEEVQGGIGLTQELGDGSVQCFYIERAGLRELITALRMLEGSEGGA